MIDKNKQICISGGNGFIGRYVVQELKNRGYNNLIVFSSKECDLRDECQVKNLFHNHNISYFLHLSALCGGIGINSKEGPRFFTDNMLQGLHTINYAAKYGCEKFVFLSTICAYPDVTDFKEESLWNGREQITNRPYSSSKRALQVLLESHNMPSSVILLGNSYGPLDNFTDTGHVIPEVIRKLVKYKKTGEKPVFFGSGEASRTFTYCTDSASGIVDVFEKYNGDGPINIGSEEEITIRNLVSKIAEIIEVDEDWTWDISLPNGQMKRKLNCEKARNELGWSPKVSLQEGLEATIKWYKEQNV